MSGIATRRRSLSIAGINIVKVNETINKVVNMIPKDSIADGSKKRAEKKRGITYGVGNASVIDAGPRAASGSGNRRRPRRRRKGCRTKRNRR